MGLKKILFNYKAFIFLSFSIAHLPCYSQDFSGLKNLSYKYKYYYAYFNQSNFSIVSFMQSPYQGKTIDLVENVGSGKFIIKKNKLFLMFDCCTEKMPFYSGDSLAVQLSDKEVENNDINIKIKLHFKHFNIHNNVVNIFTDSGKIMKSFMKDSVEISLSDTVFIKSLQLSIMLYVPRELPYSRNHRYYRYDYFINDTGSVVNYIQNETWILDLKKAENLTEGNIRYLKGVASADKHFEAILKEWLK